MVDGPKNVNFVRFADVATRNVFFDDTNGFVHALVVCCDPVTTFAGSKFLFCIAFGTEFLAVGCLVLNSIGTLLVVVCGVDGVFVKVRYHTVAHAFVYGTGAGFLLHCLTVCVFGAGVCEVFALFLAFSFFGQSRQVMTCSCPLLTHFSVRVCCHCTGWMRAFRPSFCKSRHRTCRSWSCGKLLAVESQQLFSYVKSHSVTSVSPYKSVGVCCFTERTTFIMSVVAINYIMEVCSTSSSCNSSSSIIHDGTPLAIDVFYFHQHF